MIVYRCENPETGRGPYHNLDLNGELLRNHNDMSKYPTPQEDMGEYNNNKLACGFTNLSQLCYWFTNYQRSELRKNGWRFFAFDVENVSEMKIGKRQCLFRREKAKKLKELSEYDISHSEQNWTDKAGVETGSPQLSGQDYDLSRLADDGGIDLS